MSQPGWGPAVAKQQGTHSGRVKVVEGAAGAGVEKHGQHGPRLQAQPDCSLHCRLPPGLRLRLSLRLQSRGPMQQPGRMQGELLA